MSRQNSQGSQPTAPEASPSIPGGTQSSEMAGVGSLSGSSLPLGVQNSNNVSQGSNLRPTAPIFHADSSERAAAILTRSDRNDTTSHSEATGDQSVAIAPSGNSTARPDPKIWDIQVRPPLAHNVKSFAPMLSGPAVIILVGPTRTSFSMPMAILFHFSDYAVRALTGPFHEASGSTLILPDTDPKVFSMLLVYIYQGQLNIREYCRRYALAWMGDAYEALTDTCLLLCRFYVLVDFLQCRYWYYWVQKDILNQLQDLFEEADKARMPTPVLPRTFLEVMRTTDGKCRLAEMIIQDLRAEFAKIDHRPMREYTECIREYPDVFLDMFERVVDGFHWGDYHTGSRPSLSDYDADYQN